jgi:predicted nucleic acid-binding protein
LARVFLDTNILLRHLLQDVPGQSERATDFLQEIQEGRLDARISELVVLEMVFTLERTYKRRKPEIGAAVLALLDLPGLELPGKQHFREVFDRYVDLNISFADAYHSVLMDRLGLQEVVTFDRDFDRVPGIKRLEP